MPTAFKSTVLMIKSSKIVKLGLAVNYKLHNFFVYFGENPLGYFKWNQNNRYK